MRRARSLLRPRFTALDVHSVRERDERIGMRHAERIEMPPIAGEQQEIAGSRGRGDQPIGEAGFTPLAVAASDIRPAARPISASTWINLSSKASSSRSSHSVKRAARSTPPARRSLQIPCSISATVIVER